MLHSIRFLVSAFALLTVNLAAQAQQAPTATHRPALVRLGLGGSLNGSGDYGVTKLHVEYAPEFGRHVRLGSRLALISGSQPYYFGEYSNDQSYSINQFYRALNVEQEAYWLPFGVNKAVEFSVGVGIYVGYSARKEFLGSGVYSKEDIAGKPGFVSVYPKEPITGLPELVFGYRKLDERGVHAGYIASLNLDVALNQERTWRVGGRLALQNDTRATILPGAQLVFSRTL